MAEGLTESASIDASIDADAPYPKRNFKGRRYKADPGAKRRRHGLSCHELPAGCSYVKSLVTEFRKKLEEAVTKSKGEISISDAALINTAARCEQHALLAGRWLREGYEKMTVDQKLATSREIIRGSLERDRSLKQLQIDETGRNNLKSIYDDFPDESESPLPAGPSAPPASPEPSA